MSQYPSKDIERASVHEAPRARIAAVEVDSPAYDAGFEPGCLITSVDGEPLRDVIDWRWLTSEECITLGYVDLDGEAGEVELWRDPGESWGIEFDGLVFDGVKQCRNACTFCFMRQLPKGMRPSLYLRDDDFRLSFLVGTFVTLTNITPEDEARIIEQRITPLRVSLQVIDEGLRRHMIGKHAQHGVEVLDRLLAAGIEFHAQVVLVPGENDDERLRETLAWAYERPGILGVGIVPLGYTCHQRVFDHSFNDAESSRALLDIVEPFQERALEERGEPWVFAADEFYRNAYRGDVVDNLPAASHYGDFSMFEDGIGIIRSTVDEWGSAEADGTIAACARALREAGRVVHMVAGYAQREFLDRLIAQSGIGDCFRPLYVENRFFGGNVDVTGLLVGQDIGNAIRDLSDETGWSPECFGEFGGSAVGALPERPRPKGACAMAHQIEPQRAAFGGGRTECAPTNDSLPASNGQPLQPIFLVPRVVFNDDGLTLDDMTLADIEKTAGRALHMVSCSPKDYFGEIIALIAS